MPSVSATTAPRTPAVDQSITLRAASAVTSVCFLWWGGFLCPLLGCGEEGGDDVEGCGGDGEIVVDELWAVVGDVLVTCPGTVLVTAIVLRADDLR